LVHSDNTSGIGGGGSGGGNIARVITVPYLYKTASAGISSGDTADLVCAGNVSRVVTVFNRAVIL